MKPMKARRIPRIELGAPPSLPRSPPTALSTANNKAEIHPQITPQIKIFPKNPPRETSLGALSRSFKGFSSFLIGGEGGIIPPMGGMLVGSKVIWSVIHPRKKSKAVIFVCINF
jgi:hypothetical protein